MSAWTPTEDVRLAELWNAGRSASQIARALTVEFRKPRSRNAVIGRKDRISAQYSLEVRTGGPPPRVQNPKPKRIERPVRPAEMDRPRYLPGSPGQPRSNEWKYDAQAPGVDSVLDLEPHHCRWPIKRGFCGCPKQDFSSYCEDHHAQSRTFTPNLRKR